MPPACTLLFFLPFPLHTAYHAFTPSMLHSSVLISFPFITCSLPLCHTDCMLQPQSCSTRWPQHNASFPLFHCCVHPLSHHPRPVPHNHFACVTRLWWYPPLILPVPCIFVPSLNYCNSTLAALEALTVYDNRSLPDVSLSNPPYLIYLASIWMR